jgi:hypothetical protein
MYKHGDYMVYTHAHWTQSHPAELRFNVDRVSIFGSGFGVDIHIYF